VTREHARRKRCAALLEEECEVGDDRAGEREQDADLDGSVLHREDAGTTGAKRPLPLPLSTGLFLRLTCRSQGRVSSGGASTA
jgi:hypothetical protein